MARYDFAGYDSFGRLGAILEVKARPGTDAAWATQKRDSLLQRGALPPKMTFCLLVPERGYIWEADAPAGTAPEEFDLGPHLAPYFTRLEISPREIVPEAFEMLVGWWLSDLAASTGSVGEWWLALLGRLEWQHEVAA